VANKRALGELGERIAEAFLLLKGYEIIHRNYRFARREIDIIARKDHYVIGVEVKLRRGSRFGAAVEAVDDKKVARLKMAVEGFLRNLPETVKPRIDLVVIDVSADMQMMNVNHIEGIY
jgi:putative endonuclease